jgi:putative copper resistance protein D
VVIAFESVPLWIELLAVAFSAGILVFSLWVFSPGEYPAFCPQNRWWRLFMASVVIAVAGSSLDFLLRVAEMSGNTVLSSFAVVPAVLTKTHSGKVWLIRTACLVLMLLTGIIRKAQKNRSALIVLFCLVVVIALAESASGHAADKGDFSLDEIMNWIHILGALIWAGGIFVLFFVVLPRRMDLKDRGVFNAFSLNVANFSRIAGFAVSAVVITALYNGVVYAGSFGALVKTAYGVTLSTKIGLLISLLLLAGYNRYIIVPALGQFIGAKSASSSFFSHIVAKVYTTLSPRKTEADVLKYFKRALRLEMLLMLGLLYCAALLRHEIPARHAMHHDHQGMPSHEHMHN